MEKPRDDVCGCCGRPLPRGPLFLRLEEIEERRERERPSGREEVLDARD